MGENKQAASLRIRFGLCCLWGKIKCTVRKKSEEGGISKLNTELEQIDQKQNMNIMQGQDNCWYYTQIECVNYIKLSQAGGVECSALKLLMTK